MIEICLQRVKDINPRNVEFYVWIRRLFDSVDMRLSLQSIYIKKQTDLIKEYAQVMPLIYTIFEKFMRVEKVKHPPELEGLSPARIVEMTKEYSLNTTEGIIESVEAVLQLLEFYIKQINQKLVISSSYFIW